MPTILTVDDRAINRQFLNTLLGYFDTYRVLEAADGGEALAIARADRPDVVIADIVMPGMDGFELVRQMRTDAALVGIPVIFYSATYRVAEARKLAAACGVKYVIGKPSEPEEILAIVSAALAEAARSPGIAAHAAGSAAKELMDAAGGFQAIGLRLGAIIELSLNITTERDRGRLLDMCCSAACDIVGAQRALFVVNEAPPGAPRLFSSCGYDASLHEALEDAAKRGELLRDPPTGRQVLRRNNVGDDWRTLGLPPVHPPVRSFIAAALHVAGRDLGWLCLIDKVGRASSFSDEDQRLAQTLAALSAVAYDSLLLYEDVAEHAARLRLEIAERRNAEARARAREEQLSGLAANLPGVVFRCSLAADETVTLTYVSDRVRELFGYTAYELMSDPGPLIARCAPEFRETFLRAASAATLDQSTIEFDCPFATRDGTMKWARAIATLRSLTDGVTVWDGIVLDVTEQKRQERQRRSIEEQLRQAQKMETVGQLAGGIAHDFNNSLTVIMSSIENIVDSGSADDEVRAAAEMALHATEQAATLANRLLAFSRRQELAPVDVDVGAVLEDLHKILRSTVPPEIGLTVRVASGLGRCVLDRTQLETSVMNLVVNARDAIGGRGEITIAIEGRNIDPRQSEAPVDARAGDWVVVSVSDDGAGMSEEVQAHIFEPFFTTKEVGKGTGLGLSQIHGFVAQSGGFVTVRSRPGSGTRVSLHFPAQS